ncbi:hypothetical protein [Vibrio owensii]|uniref:hypothetical protein n=1 Tax=Vibrio owensii TaxID=696485 RepID=UPI003CC505F1
MSEVEEREKELTMLLNSFQKNGLKGIAKMATYSFSFKEHFNHAHTSRNRDGEVGMYLKVNFSKAPDLEKVIFTGLSHTLTGNFELVGAVNIEECTMTFRRPLTENYLHNERLQIEAKRYALSKISQALKEQANKIREELTNIGIKEEPNSSEQRPKKTRIGLLFSSLLGLFNFA